MKNKKLIIRFITVFIISFIIMEIIEKSIEYFFNVDMHNLKWGWLGFLVIYGFKWHIFCCLIPAIWASYKCRHKKCKHDYCDAVHTDTTNDK
jgi:hypothetical protein